jgi:hypothetical protein
MIPIGILGFACNPPGMEGVTCAMQLINRGYKQEERQ